MDGPYLVPLRTSAGVAITGKVKADFALTYYVDGVDTATTAITITEVGTSGDYVVYVPDPATSTDHTLLLEDGGSLGVPSTWIAEITWPNRPDVTDIISAGGTVSYDGPVTPTGDVEIVYGDDYYNADGRALTWTNPSWPSLIGSTIVLSVRDIKGNPIITNAPGVVVSADTIYVELSKAQSATTLGTHEFDVMATLANTHVVRLQLGDFRIRKAITRD